jgi:hypothetical protein
MALARATQYCTPCRNGNGDSSEAGSQWGQEPGPDLRTGHLKERDDDVQPNGTIRQCSDVASVVQEVDLSSQSNKYR